MSQALATANQTNQRENYCKLLIWWKSPDEIDDQDITSVNHESWHLGNVAMGMDAIFQRIFCSLLRRCPLWGLFKRFLALLASSPIDLSYSTNYQK